MRDHPLEMRGGVPVIVFYEGNEVSRGLVNSGQQVVQEVLDARRRGGPDVVLSERADHWALATVDDDPFKGLERLALHHQLGELQAHRPVAGWCNDGDARR